jgi:hypothetical protein
MQKNEFNVFIKNAVYFFSLPIIIVMQAIGEVSELSSSKKEKKCSQRLSPVSSFLSNNISTAFRFDGERE